MLNRTGRSPAKGSSRSRGTQGSLFPWAMPRLDWWVPDAVAGDCVAEIPVLPVGSTFTPRHRSISATNHGPETRVAVSPKGQPEKILSVHSFQDRAAKWINKISHSTGPYSPDQGGPPDKTSGVEASSCVHFFFFPSPFAQIQERRVQTASYMHMCCCFPPLRS